MKLGLLCSCGTSLCTKRKSEKGPECQPLHSVMSSSNLCELFRHASAHKV